MTDRRKFPDEELDAFVLKVQKLRKEGLSNRVVAERLGVSPSTITARWIRWKARFAPGEKGE
jgi:transposase